MRSSTLLATTVVCFVFVAMSARVSISDAKAFQSDSVAISGERRLADNAENTEERNWFTATIGKLRGKTKEPLSPEESKAALTKILNDNQHGKADDFFKDIRRNPGLIDDALKNQKVISVLNSFGKKKALNENDMKKLHKVILKELTANDGKISHAKMDANLAVEITLFIGFLFVLGLLVTSVMKTDENYSSTH
ncbi:hypothetical protein CCR75_000878 [Bremia lactucae]|uniref:Secreted RxLR effector peptide protein n=1 Tax=Bremia lactucae TaxID=4779 RepID=A0A976FNH9_BRELC|nr:hypothetical protein CCR75_000878 [Bremia lactucae]